MDTRSTKDSNVVILAVVSACVNDEAFQSFWEIYSLNSRNKQPTCFKNPENSSCINFIPRNKSCSFQIKYVVEKTLSYYLNKLIYNKQRNHCISCRNKSKNILCEIKWKVHTPILENFCISLKRQWQKLFFFSIVVKSFKISECLCEHNLLNNESNHLALKLIMKVTISFCVYRKNFHEFIFQIMMKILIDSQEKYSRQQYSNQSFERKC